MDLDKLDEYHPVTREHMRQAYFAYLQNNPGSKKAIYECVKQSDKELAEKENEESAESRPNSSRAQKSPSRDSRPQSAASKHSAKEN